MGDSIFDLMSRFREEQGAACHEVKDITIGRDTVPLERLTVPASDAAPLLFGIPVRVSKYVPKDCGIMQTCCHHTFFEQQADGGELMHMAKRHTVILKFDAADRTPKEGE